MYIVIDLTEQNLIIDTGQKKHPRAYVDFYKSDCWYHAKAYKCSSLGKMTKCDGLNSIYRKGVKDCSSWKGKPKHKNWPKTAWYRN